MSLTFIEPNTVHDSDYLQRKHILSKVIAVFENDRIQRLNCASKRIRIFPDEPQGPLSRIHYSAAFGNQGA